MNDQSSSVEDEEIHSVLGFRLRRHVMTLVDNRRSIHVYIASPYTKGDTAINVRFQLRTWDQLFSLGFTPIAPLWTHFQHLHAPRPYADWTSYDNEIIERCDVCLRLDAIDDDYKQSESSGADKEVELFLSLGKPVFTSVEQLLSWSHTRDHQSEKATKPNRSFREILQGWFTWADKNGTCGLPFGW